MILLCLAVLLTISAMKHVDSEIVPECDGGGTVLRHLSSDTVLKQVDGDTVLGSGSSDIVCRSGVVVGILSVR